MDDDTLDAIDASEFWLQDTAMQADSMPVESMDFGVLLGDVVPRDGLQRPLLTSGSPVRTARAPPREQAADQRHARAPDSGAELWTSACCSG